MTNRKPGGDLLGAIQKPCSLLLVGPPGSGKLEFCIHLMKQYAEENEKIIYLTVDVSPEMFREKAAECSFKLGEFASNLLILDGYTSLSASSKLEGLDWSISSLTNLEALLLCVEKAISRLGPQPKIFVYTLSTLFLYNPSLIAYKFLRAFTSKVESNQGSIIYAVQAGVHDEPTVTMMKSCVDGVIETKYDEEMSRFLRLHHFRSMDVDGKWRKVSTSSGNLVLEA